MLQKQEWQQAIALNNQLLNKWDATKRTLYGYFNAVCYYELGEFDKAIDEVTKAASFYSSNYDYVYSQSFLLLGKIYEKKGETRRATENYEKSLELWKNADADLLDLIDAKARLAGLKKNGKMP